MIRTLSLSLIAAGSLVTTGAFAATTTVKKHATTTTHAGPARMVTTKTSTGKTITYDCAKTGNANKVACKK